MIDNRLKKQFDFILEIDKEKQIMRQTLLSDASRFENDSEHAWHMAVMCFLLSEYSNEKIDVLKTIKMILIHDIVEIDSGDTYAYDEVGKATQHKRNPRLPTDFLIFYLKIRQKNSIRFGWSLKNKIRLRQDLQKQWTTYNPIFSIMQLRAECG